MYYNIQSYICVYNILNIYKLRVKYTCRGEKIRVYPNYDHH